MKRSGRIVRWTRLAVATLALLGGCAAQAVDLRSVIGAWQVSDVYCARCGKLGRGEIGSALDITASSASSPLVGGACPQQVDFHASELPPAARKPLVAKLDPAWLDRQSQPPDLVVVTCGGLDFMVLVALPNDRLALIGDGDVTYRFSRSGIKR